MFKIVVVGVVMAALGFLAGVVVLPALGEDRAASQAAVTGDQADVAAMHESCEAGEMGDMQAMMETAHAEGADSMPCQEGDGAGEVAADGASGSGSGMMGSGMMGMMSGGMHK